MPDSDPYGQGVQIASITDAPNGPRLARDLANGLVPRSVMRFASAAERNATISTPAFGMTASIAAEGLLTWYDGAEWVVIASGTTAWTQPALANGYANNGNNQGNFRWRAVNLFGETAVFLQGGIIPTYSPQIPGSGVFLAAPLPVYARPTTVRTFLVPCSDVGSSRIALKVDAHTDGRLEIFGTNSSDIRPVWIGFNGVSYTL